ncbi:MAG: hypothetical protein [Siphoviridae sp. ctpQM7]|nr:MAG: hypothetical protein [Siphoviridae sp. ctpQM7]
MYQSLIEGETVYTILRHVSRSGMFRVIDAYVMRSHEGRGNVPVRILAVLTDEQKNSYQTGTKNTMGFVCMAVAWIWVLTLLATLKPLRT